jgi:hypothetical protein
MSINGHEVTTVMDSDSFKVKKELHHNLSLSSINRFLLLFKKLTTFEGILQLDLLHFDPVIVSSDTMPQLHSYIHQASEKLGVINKPVVLLAQQNGFGIYSRKALFFKGTLVIGKNLLRDVSDEELEALIVRELSSITHNHTNKKWFLHCAILGILYTLLKDNTVKNNPWICYVVPLLLTRYVLSKKFENQVDLESSLQGNEEGLITYYKQLENKERLRDKNFNCTYDSIQKSRPSLSFLSYVTLMAMYYTSVAEHNLVQVYNSIVYNSPRERISNIRQQG